MTHNDEIHLLFDVILYWLSTLDSLIGLLKIQNSVSTLMYYFFIIIHIGVFSIVTCQSVYFMLLLGYMFKNLKNERNYFAFFTPCHGLSMIFQCCQEVVFHYLGNLLPMPIFSAMVSM